MIKTTESLVVWKSRYFSCIPCPQHYVQFCLFGKIASWTSIANKIEKIKFLSFERMIAADAAVRHADRLAGHSEAFMRVGDDLLDRPYAAM